VQPASRKTEVEIMDFSEHARLRAAQRCLSPRDVELVRAYGRRLHRTGIVFCFLGRRDLPAGQPVPERLARLAGTVLLVSPDGELITAYRNPAAWRQIRKKPKRRAGAGGGTEARPRRGMGLPGVREPRERACG